MGRRAGDNYLRPGCPVGVVGLGLMGVGIATRLLASGHPVVAVDRARVRRRQTPKLIGRNLDEMAREGLWRGNRTDALARLCVTEDKAGLGPCRFVAEAVFEDISAKRKVIREIEGAVSGTTLIGSNTSAIPITNLQRGARRPGRILGVHWAEPAHITRFLEIICGRHTLAANARKLQKLARRWGKDPAVVRKDIRGFVANRIMYAMLREAFHLVDSGIVTPAEVDHCVRNDMGWWMTFAGPFRLMDLTGIPAYAAVMRELFPELDRGRKLPRLMRKILAAGARGTANRKGFYPYTRASAHKWEKDFIKFSYDIRRLAMKYQEPGSSRSSPRRTIRRLQ